MSGAVVTKMAIDKQRKRAGREEVTWGTHPSNGKSDKAPARGTRDAQRRETPGAMGPDDLNVGAMAPDDLKKLEQAAIMVQKQFRALLARRRMSELSSANEMALAAQEMKEAAIRRVRAVEQGRQAVERRMPGVFSCFLCCCCRTLGGINTMLTSDNTRDFALAVILGESFYTLIEELCDAGLSPMFAALTTFMNDPEALVLENPGNFLILIAGVEMRDNGLKYTTAVSAINDGAVVFDYGRILARMLTFVLIVYGAYMIFELLQKMKEFTKMLTGDANEDQEYLERKAREAAEKEELDRKEAKSILDFLYKPKPKSAVFLQQMAGLPSSVVVLTANPMMQVVKLSGVNLPPDLAARYRQQLSGGPLSKPFLPTMLAELSTKGYVIASQVENNYTLLRDKAQPAPPAPPAPPFSFPKVGFLHPFTPVSSAAPN